MKGSRQKRASGSHGGRFSPFQGEILDRLNKAVDALQAMEKLLKSQPLPYVWKKVNSIEYLYQLTDSKGGAKYVGERTVEREAEKHARDTLRRNLKESIRKLGREITDLEIVNRALRLPKNLDVHSTQRLNKAKLVSRRCLRPKEGSVARHPHQLLKEARQKEGQSRKVEDFSSLQRETMPKSSFQEEIRERVLSMLEEENRFQSLDLVEMIDDEDEPSDYQTGYEQCCHLAKAYVALGLPLIDSKADLVPERLVETGFLKESDLPRIVWKWLRSNN